jgi:hypothetical protein
LPNYEFRYRWITMVVSNFCQHVFDAINVNLRNTLVLFLGIISTLAKVVNREGLRGLYRGNKAQMVRIFPYAATQFSSYEYYKKVNISHLVLIDCI